MVVWLLALVVGVIAITAVQVAAYYYLVRDEPTSTVDPEAVSVGESDHTRRPVPDRDGPQSGVCHCSACGAPNDADPVFTFCQNCGDQL
jgi:hypothetical protein